MLILVDFLCIILYTCLFACLFNVFVCRRYTAPPSGCSILSRRYTKYADYSQPSPSCVDEPVTLPTCNRRVWAACRTAACTRRSSSRAERSHAPSGGGSLRLHAPAQRSPYRPERARPLARTSRVRTRRSSRRRHRAARAARRRSSTWACGRGPCSASCAGLRVTGL